MSFLKLFINGFLLTIFIQTNSIGQKDNFLEIKLNWSEKKSLIFYENGQAMSFPNLENSFYDGTKFIFIHNHSKEGNYTLTYDLVSFNYVDISSFEKDFISNLGLNLSDSVSFEVRNIGRNGKSKAILELVPFIKVNNEIKKIIDIRFRLKRNEIYLNKNNPYADNSVLASGDWYKIKVYNDGIYKLDYEFLNQIGIDLELISSNQLNIFGNGFGRLPELNSDWRPDDLIKNKIQVYDGGDGKIDPGDYLLFYAKGPHKWEESGSYGFSQIRNIYANHSAYFIHVSEFPEPLRIQSINTDNLISNISVNSFDDFAIHESESKNLLKGGQRWYGEEFDIDLSQSFSFSFPFIVQSEPVIVRSFFAYKFGGSNSLYSISYNGDVVGSAALTAVNDDNSWGRSGFTSLPGSLSPTSSTIVLNANFNRNNPADIGYLDFIEVNARRSLNFYGNQFIFRDRNSVGIGNVAEFQVSNVNTNVKVWEITDPTSPSNVEFSFQNNSMTFKVETDSLRTFIAFNSDGFLVPEFIGRVSNQNLHALSNADYLIVTNPIFLTQANRLAQLHENNSTSTHVVTTEQIYNEFSGGTQDPTAIKNFAKMFYDRAKSDSTLEPKYLLLFGDGTYDPLNRVSNNNYMVPVYHSLSSEGYVSTLLSDDYFGFLDDEESFNASDDLDIAVGRLVATSNDDAINLVNKIEHYMLNGSNLYSSSNTQCENGSNLNFGDWRLKYTLIADDEENSYFLNNDLEPAYLYVNSNHPEMNVNKIYSDAFSQISTAGGERYPEVNLAIDRTIENGSILTCYVGHGGAMGAASERIITIDQIINYQNIDKLTLFVSATCEFGRIDDNERVSAGEWFALNPTGGAIALMTTTRAVYFSTNSVTTSSFFEQVFKRDLNGKPRTFGEIIKDTKNNLSTSISNNKRTFMLLGDPALRIALPFQNIILDSVNHNEVISIQDTLKALSLANFSGHLEDQFGNILNNYNGTVQPSIFDKAKLRNTLSNDLNSPMVSFQEQKNILYRGNVSVTNGIFDFEFIVPRDIDYSFGNGKASFYAFNNTQDGAGFSKGFLIGGVDTSGIVDSEGPVIELFLNDENFVNGGITNNEPILKAKLFDESGINTVGNGIGHDITVILDGNTSSSKVLNEFYAADLDTYKSGEVSYKFDAIDPGPHNLIFKAWDVNNNSSEYSLDFVVKDDEQIEISRILNYPNPFSNQTEFMFEHNQVCQELETKIEIFTASGILVKSINQLVKSDGFRINEINWDGKDNYGDKLGRGVYIYKITITNASGEQSSAIEKLYLLN